MSLPPLALYVHLPWCERKCPYCDFNSHERQDIPESAYVDALLQDIEAETAGLNRPLESIFIGGGTPSLFSVEAIYRMMDGIRTVAELCDNAEVTLEANPGSTESSRLEGYRQAGITRFSLGIQSFNNDSLAALGRIHDRTQAEGAIEVAKRSGARSFNLDLMHGLPKQTAEQGLEDLRAAISSGAPHLSWYQLTIEPNTRFYSTPPLLPAEDALAELEVEGMALLESAGYQRYEVSAWAKPGEACRHNLNYWQFGDYLAIGAGAHGKVTSAGGQVRRYAKTRRPEDYMGEGGIRRCAERDLDGVDLRGEFMLNALRLIDGFPISLFEKHTGLDAGVLHEPLDTLLSDGLVTVDAGRIGTTSLGLRFLDDVVGRFFESSQALTR